VGTFVRGDVVVLPFPFSDLSAAKRRPALVLAVLPGDGVILCQITSRPGPAAYSVSLESSDFVSGSLQLSSTVRPDHLFTADSNLILYRAGVVAPAKVREAIAKAVSILTT
jgi:mRNA interferase MazF